MLTKTNKNKIINSCSNKKLNLRLKTGLNESDRSMFKIGSKIKRNIWTWLVFDNFLKEIDRTWREISDVYSWKAWLSLFKNQVYAHTIKVRLGLAWLEISRCII